MLPAVVNAPLAGSNTSALAVSPPSTSTCPLSNTVAVTLARADVMLPVARNPCAYTSMVKFCDTASWPIESWTLTVIGNDPALVGVPERTPPLLTDKPDGSAPVSLHVNGASPNAAEKINLYGTLSVPEADPTGS